MVQVDLIIKSNISKDVLNHIRIFAHLEKYETFGKEYLHAVVISSQKRSKSCRVISYQEDGNLNLAYFIATEQGVQN